jgi:lysyl-tRNA synthetase class 2
VPAREQNSHWQPAATNAALHARADLLARVRDFFAQREILEVETPVLSGAGNSDPGLHQWCTRDPEAWLRTSPEYAMKRLLAAGSGDIYELGRVFRGDESGRHHNREFTLLEWYRVGWGYHELMDETAALVRACLPGRELTEQRLSYRALFIDYAGVDPFTESRDGLAARLAARDIDLADATPAECLDLLLSLVIQPHLPADCLTFVFDFPEQQAALARIRPGHPPVAERFELFLGPVELANGYQELTDAAEQRDRFERENRVREAAGMAPVPLDELLLEALAAGMPECAGVALGIDRLLMFERAAGALAEILAFPADRA